MKRTLSLSMLGLLTAAQLTAVPLATATAITTASAQPLTPVGGYPSQPIRFVSPFPCRRRQRCDHAHRHQQAGRHHGPARGGR
ncbi:hypothetical protein OJJOAM_000316 [Cupriavidus sp. H18C1]